MAGKTFAVLHPFYPKNLDVQNYIENDLDAVSILSGFFIGLVVLLVPLAIWMLKDYRGTMLRKMAICWLLLCGFIHTFLEGHFAWFHRDIASRMDFFSQIWKEYAKGDSRYIVRDPFTVCMETITAFVEGPLCFLTAYCFATGRPNRYILQLCVSLGQFYGCVLYFFTEYFEGFPHGPVNHPLYFWFYFVFMNILWIVIPFSLIVDSYSNLYLSQEMYDRKCGKSS